MSAIDYCLRHGPWILIVMMFSASLHLCRILDKCMFFYKQNVQN